MDFASGVTEAPATMKQVQLTDTKPVVVNSVLRIPIPVDSYRPRCYGNSTCHIKKLARIKEFTEKNKAICEGCIWPGR